MQAYSNPERESDPHALPDVETWSALYVECPECENIVQSYNCTRGSCSQCGRIVSFKGASVGWFYWFCFPGCMPDSEREGPFETEDAALADAQGEEE